MNPVLSTSAPTTGIPAEEEILRAVREVSFGVVEIVVHDRRVTEIRQTRRIRLTGGAER